VDRPSLPLDVRAHAYMRRSSAVLKMPGIGYGKDDSVAMSSTAGYLVAVV